MGTVADLIKALQAVPHTSAVVVAQPSLLAGALTAATGTFAATAHGLAVGDRVHLRTVTTTTGAVADAAGTIVFVKTVPNANSFTVAATAGGAALTGTTNGTYTASPADASVDVTAATSTGIQADGPGVATIDPGTVNLIG